MTETMLGALFEFFGVCPLISGNRLNIDYLPEGTKQAGIEYAIGLFPTDEVLRRYVDGGAHCRLPFVLSSVNDYGPDVRQNIENSGFYDAFAEWVREQSKKRAFPALPNGLTARSMRTIGPGYLFQPDADAGKYQIQCEIEYYRKGDR
ncbi:MAG: hypothetical protein FWF10_00610 [Clostridiales bacterium]|nr:hypothetical protein [Clostridiales bacterium]